MCINPAGHLLLDNRMAHTNAIRSQSQALPQLRNNFYCYQSKKAEDTVKQAKFEPPGKNRFFL